MTKQTNRSKAWRRRLAQIVLLMAASLLSLSALALPKIEQWTDASGVPVYFVHETVLPIAGINLIFSGGHAREGALKGLSNLCIATWGQAAAGLDSDEISVRFSDYGTSYGLHNGRDNVVASLNSLTAYHGNLEQALDLFIDILTKPDFPASELERIKKNVLTQLRNQQENPGAIAGKAFTKAIYGDHPYAHPGIGYEETVSRITVDDIRDFYQRYIVTANLSIAIVGDLSRTQAESIAHRLATSLPAGTQAAAIPPVAALEQEQNIHIPFPTQQVHVLIGQPLIEKGNADFFALRLANHVLGGSGFGSRIMEEVRVKRGLAYSSHSYFQSFRQAGPFVINFQTKKEQLNEALTLVKGLVDEFVAAGINEEEFALSLASIRGNYALHMASNQSILNAIGTMAFYNLGIDYFDDYLERFDQLDIESVNSTIKKHLRPQKMVTVVVGGDNPWQ